MLVTQHLSSGWPKALRLRLHLTFSSTRSEGKGLVPIFQMRKTEAQKRKGRVLSSSNLVEERAKAHEQSAGH